jgi:hypothetical protein
MADSIDALERRINTIESQIADKASLATMKQVQHELREYIEAQDEKQSKYLHREFEVQTKALRDGVLSEVRTLLRDDLANWVETSLQPIVGQILDQHKKDVDAARQREMEKWKTRIAVATAAIVLLWSVVLPFLSITPGEQARYSRAADTLHSLP